MNTNVTQMMNWEQKYAAILAVAPGTTILMRSPGDWFVNASMEHAESKSLLVGHYGNGKSPEEAVEAHWELYGNGEPCKVSNFLQDGWFRWNGFMWEPSRRPG